MTLRDPLGMRAQVVVVKEFSRHPEDVGTYTDRSPNLALRATVPAIPARRFQPITSIRVPGFFHPAVMSHLSLRTLAAAFLSCLAVWLCLAGRASAGLAYVTYANEGTVTQVDVLTGTELGIVAAGLSGPFGIVFDDQKNLFVTNGFKNTVSKIGPDGQVSNFAKGLNSPRGVAINAAGELFVANFASNTISRISRDGFVRPFAKDLQGPFGLAFDGAGNLYAANFASSTVSKITPDGRVRTFATGLSGPRGLAFDQKGYLYAANATNSTIGRIGPDGSVTTFARGLNSPEGLTFDDKGNLYVTNAGDDTISLVAPDGTVKEVPKFGDRKRAYFLTMWPPPLPPQIATIQPVRKLPLFPLLASITGTLIAIAIGAALLKMKRQRKRRRRSYSRRPVDA